MSDRVKNLLTQIGLWPYYPQKLSLRDALILREDTLGTTKCTDPKKLYLFMLQRIMAYDYRCRVKLLKQEDATTATQVQSEHLFGGIECEDGSVKIHPMDVLLALILCADDFLRQDLMARLAQCQLAIPFIFRDPFTGQLTIPLWAMRSIVKEWKSTLKGSEGVHECPIIRYTTPVVSFIRFSTQGRSKSKMMNEVISDSYHDHCFHFDCEGGTYDMILGEGLVEVYWYLPSGNKQNDTFPDAVTFLNLHGDARKHPNQLSFLSKASFVTFALITAKDLGEECTKVLKDLAAAPGSIVLLLCGAYEKSDETRFDQLQKELSKDKLQGINLAEMNADGIKTAIRRQITSKLENDWDVAAKQMKNYTDIAHDNGIKIDEDNEDFVKGQKLALDIMQIVQDDPVAVKKSMLPLQGENLWLEWAKEDKEEHRQVNRGSKTVEEYRSQKLKEKGKIRQLQLQELEKQSPLMKDFIRSLLGLECRENVRKYFLQSLKLYLDELSRDKISLLRREYNDKRSKLHDLQTRTDEKSIEEGKQEVVDIQRRLIEASLGLEHLLREFSQLYEVQESAQKQDQSLPQLAAKLLIDGYPLELMDGNAGHVPIRWISAVLQEVAKMLDDPKVFVVSILGLQSTGKSTLLNTAFGLQFSVSAGRCTRGAFMQMIPIAKDLSKEANCEYVLVVDTEGLRAPEQDSKMAQKHDNELATFITGFANATIVNINGQTLGDMDDILSTVVHALIRMSMRNVELNPISCQLVYHNVGAVTDGNISRSKFRDDLDRMTREAEIGEKCGEGEYDNLIQFAPEKDSHLFPGLWKGNPPMAPVNHGYSEKALGLKARLVEVMKSQSHNNLSTIEKKSREFWNVLLCENFVFSFKNTVETALETQYIQWAWEFRIQMLEFEQASEKKIKNAKQDELNSLQKELLKDSPAQKIYEELEKEMKKYFEESEDRGTLAPWQRETENRLKRLKKELEGHANRYCLEFTSIRQAKDTVMKMYPKYQAEINDRVKEFVATLDSRELRKGLSDSEVKGKLNSLFNEKWDTWIEDLKYKASIYQDEVDTDVTVEGSIMEFHKNEEQIVIMKLGEKPLSEWGEELQLEFKEEYVRLKHNRGSSHLPRQVTDTCTRKKFTETTTECVFDLVSEFLGSIENEKFNPVFIHQLVRIVSDCISKRSAHNPYLDFTLDYIIEMTLTACGYAAKQFRRMEEKFRDQSDPLTSLDKEKEFDAFMRQFLEIAGDRAAACALCDLLTDSIKKNVLSSLGNVIFDGIVAQRFPHFANKAALKARILIDLGEDLQKSRDLKDYFLHLKDAGSSLKKWIERYTMEYCKSPHEGGQSQLVHLANGKLKDVVKRVGDMADEATETLGHKDGVDTQQWLSSFCSKLTSTLEADNISDLGGVLKLNNTEKFMQEVKSELQRLQNDLQDKFEQMGVDELLDTDTCQNKPHLLLYDKIAGCLEQCPFCKEQCDSTNNEHTVKHSAQQHRPQCLGGYRWTDTQKMIIDVCSSLVGSDRNFRNDDTNQQWVPYSEFYRIYPNWSIAVDKSANEGTSAEYTYWKWFVGHHDEEIAKHFGMKTNEFPSEWRNLTWEDAKNDMKKAYKV